MKNNMMDNKYIHMLRSIQSKLSGLFKRQENIFRILIPLVILATGIGAASYLKHSGPKTKKRPPTKPIPVVRVETLQPSSYPVIISAMGTVIPAREMVLKPRVAGEIVEMHPEFTEGGLLQKDMQVLQIDPEDYRLNLSQKQSAVTDAEYALKLELGHQTVAQREWELLNGTKPQQEEELELALRKPHLDKARADLAAAQADLKRAALELERTRITAPFNAMVRSKAVDLGSQVTPQEPLAELVGTDAYRVRVSVPVDRLEWIQIPAGTNDSGSQARIIYGQGHECNGTVIRLMGDLSDEGRMARILVEVMDPLGLTGPPNNRPPLLIGEYVRVEIQGRELDNVFQIPRSALRDNSRVWIAGKNHTLEIRRVNPIWRDADVVLLKNGLTPGEQIIVSDLPAPVAGLKLRTAGSPTQMSNSRPAQEKTAEDRSS